MNAVAVPAAEAAVVSPRARRRRILRRRFMRRPVAVASLFVIFVFLLVALFAPLIAPESASQTDFTISSPTPPGSTCSAPTSSGATSSRASSGERGPR